MGIQLLFAIITGGTAVTVLSGGGLAAGAVAVTAAGVTLSGAVVADGFADFGRSFSSLKSDLAMFFESSGGGGESLPKVNIETSKLQHEFRHANDFGINGNWNKTNERLYKQAIEQHIDNATNIFKSTYRGQDVYTYINTNTGIGVYTDLSGNYIGGWKFSTRQINFHFSNGIPIK